jgi:hypothetical protein
MAVTRTLIFTGAKVNAVALTTHLVDSAEVTIEPVNDTIDDGQSLTAAWDVSFSFKVYDDAVLTNNAIYKASTGEPTKVAVDFDGAPGGVTLSITGVIVNATPQFDENRVSYLITGSKRVTSLTSTVTLTPVA